MLKSTSNWPHLACVMAELVIQREAHATQYKTVQGVLEQKENLQEIRCGAVAAVLNSQPPEVNVLYDIARQKQVSSFDNVEKHVASVKIYLNQAEERILPRKDCKQTLEELTRELDSAVIHMQTAADLAREMNRLKPDHAEENARSKGEKTLGRIKKHRRVIATKLTTFATSLQPQVMTTSVLRLPVKPFRSYIIPSKCVC